MGLNGEINKTVAIAGECAKEAPHCLRDGIITTSNKQDLVLAGGSVYLMRNQELIGN